MRPEGIMMVPAQAWPTRLRKENKGKPEEQQGRDLGDASG